MLQELARETLDYRLESKNLLIFDFDGVLVDSVNIKTEAFAALFEPFGPEIREKVVNHHQLNGGMSRYEKFTYYYETFMGQKLAPKVHADLNTRFSQLVKDRVLSAAEIPGAGPFLSHYASGKACFVCSATPETELRDIVDGRGLARFFAGVYGSPSSKADIIARILRERGAEPAAAVFFGDAINDLVAAQSCGVDFVGIGHGWHRDQDCDTFIGTLVDFGAYSTSAGQSA